MMKAMILAAGRGERLRPLTDSVPKPLLKIGEHCLIEYHLVNLARLGIQDVVINLNYLKDAIMDHLGDGQNYGLSIHYSVEEPGPLETGGGIFQAVQKGLLDENPFIVLSADVWTDYPLEALTLDRDNDDAHLVLVDNPRYHPNGDFGLVNKRVNSREPLLTYANLAVLHPRIFADAAAGYFKLAPLLMSAINRNRVSGVHYQGAWFNIGTLEDLTEINTYRKHRE